MVQLAELAMEARPLRMEPAFDIWQLGVVRYFSQSVHPSCQLCGICMPRLCSL